MLRCLATMRRPHRRRRDRYMAPSKRNELLTAVTSVRKLGNSIAKYCSCRSAHENNAAKYAQNGMAWLSRHLRRDRAYCASNYPAGQVGCCRCQGAFQDHLLATMNKTMPKWRKAVNEGADAGILLHENPAITQSAANVTDCQWLPRADEIQRKAFSADTIRR